MLKYQSQPPQFKWHWIILAILLMLLVVRIVRAEIYHSDIQIKASWYSIESLKKEGTWKTSKGVMANGKQYDENKLTCATRLYPLGTKILITNKQNKKSVAVLVSDRVGKRFAKTRIDLSKKAFALLAPLSQGVIPITVEVLCLKSK